MPHIVQGDNFPLHFHIPTTASIPILVRTVHHKIPTVHGGILIILQPANLKTRGYINPDKSRILLIIQKLVP
jgi:hypothetical protein